MNGTVLVGFIVKLWNIVILVLHCILMLLTGNRVASAAQAGGSYYLNYTRTCSAIVWELETFWKCWGCWIGFRCFDWLRKKRATCSRTEVVVGCWPELHFWLYGAYSEKNFIWRRIITVTNMTKCSDLVLLKGEFCWLCRNYYLVKLRSWVEQFWNFYLLNDRILNSEFTNLQYDTRRGEATTLTEIEI